MERRRLGRTDLQVSVLGFGGAEIGDGHAAQAAVDRLLGEAPDAGLNVIDTGECALDSETLIGRSGTAAGRFTCSPSAGTRRGWASPIGTRAC